MAKSFSVGTALKEDFPALMSLFQEVFGDSSAVINNFFEKTVTEENTVCVRDGKKIVSMLYIVDCEIHLSGAFYKCAYIYAVGTQEEYRGKGCMRLSFDYLEKIAKERGYSYLILVPENDGLFKMYEKFGFETGLTASLVKYRKSKPQDLAYVKEGSCSYGLYRAKKIEDSGDVPVVILGEKGFECFFYPSESGIFTLHSANGYCIYEVTGEDVFVHEVFGNKQDFFNCIFTKTGKNEILCYEPSNNGSRQIGMIKILDDSPRIRNIFFGIPYGG